MLSGHVILMTHIRYDAIIGRLRVSRAVAGVAGCIAGIAGCIAG